MAAAPIYRTEPVSAIPQPDYLNTVVYGFTTETPEALHAHARRLEAALGRRPRGRDAPREIDIDLLLVGELQRSGAGLELPHPRLRERRFVLAPLCDVAPDLPVPPDGVTVRHLLTRLPDVPRVERWGVGGEPSRR